MPYRIELSANKRAGCKDTVCKKAEIKIQKGEIRFGSWFTLPNTDKGSWAWKHWGCVTPKQLKNLQEECEGDLEYVDGYEDLPAEWQVKVKRALEQQHVDDEDWKHDPAMNRVDSVAKRTPKAKKAKVNDDQEEGDQSDAVEHSPTKAAGKKRGRPQKGEAADHEEKAAAPKRRAKKAKIQDDSAVEDDDEPTRGTKSNAADVDSDAAINEVKPAAKRGRGRKAVVADDLDSDVETEAKAKPKVKAKAKAATKKGGRKKKAAVDDDEEE